MGSLPVPWAAESFDVHDTRDGSLEVIVQWREGGLRLIRQHDHGLVSGDLAHAWMEAEGAPPVSPILVTATALHDLSWRPADEVPSWNPATLRPHDFQDYPADDKFSDVQDGLVLIEEVDAYAALLVSLHYATFPGAPEWFVEGEEDRRDRLGDEIGVAIPADDAIEDDLELLRLFDALSLYLCLTGPGTLPSGRPKWLGDQFSVNGWDDLLSARWAGPSALALDPWPFGSAPVTTEVPYRDLARTSFDSEEQLVQAWNAADERIWRVTLVAD